MRLLEDNRRFVSNQFGIQAVHSLMPRAHWAKIGGCPIRARWWEKKSAKLRAWCAPSSLINIKNYANLGEMCEDAPSRLLGASCPPSMRISPTSCLQKMLKNMGPRKLWCASGMGVEGAHTFLEGEILGENMEGEFGGRCWGDNLAGDSATISFRKNHVTPH